jgi:hypothetical protein
MVTAVRNVPNAAMTPAVLQWREMRSSWVRLMHGNRGLKCRDVYR